MNFSALSKELLCFVLHSDLETFGIIKFILSLFVLDSLLITEGKIVGRC
jgi:hypothetical protein